MEECFDSERSGRRSQMPKFSDRPLLESLLDSGSRATTSSTSTDIEGRIPIEKDDSYGLTGCLILRVDEQKDIQRPRETQSFRRPC
ncbi:unnamed protein product [Linum trigynum]|uniref:Uncharacterized protein n=1 Tax=Linum trigynum TaxID=586398 RepID=A0AAV2FUD1_9ROSI